MAKAEAMENVPCIPPTHPVNLARIRSEADREACLKGGIARTDRARSVLEGYLTERQNRLNSTPAAMMEW